MRWRHVSRTCPGGEAHSSRGGWSDIAASRRRRDGGSSTRRASISEHLASATLVLAGLLMTSVGCGSEAPPAPPGSSAIGGGQGRGTPSGTGGLNTSGTGPLLVLGPAASWALAPGETCPAGVPPQATCTRDSECASTERCVPGACDGGSICVPAGRACGSSTECPADTECEAGVCASRASACSDSRECPPGFACESTGQAPACVDRRLPCVRGLDLSGPCPAGFACEDRGASRPYCYARGRICDPTAPSTTPCPPGTSCISTSEPFALGHCLPPAVAIPPDQGEVELPVACIDDTDCQGIEPAAGAIATVPRCGIDVTRGRRACSANSLCFEEAAGCVGGYTCTQVHDADFLSCLAPGGCADDSVCPAGQLCFDVDGNGVSECVSAPGTPAPPTFE